MCEVDDVSKTYGYPPHLWEAAKEKLRKKLWDIARLQGWITYGEAAREIADLILFDPHNRIFHLMLGQISVEKDAAGRGMLSALVVYQDEGIPGGGFFDLAKDLDRDTRDRMKCWIAEINRLYEEAAELVI